MEKGIYSPELRSFALTLNFYSPAAYNYVRKTFEDSFFFNESSGNER